MSIKDKRLEPEKLTEIILQSISDGVFTVDREWRITSFNRAAEEITGVSRKEALGKSCCEVFRSNMCERDCALRRTMRQGKPIVDSSTYIVDAHQKRIPVTVSTAVLKDARGRIIGGVETFRDMSLVESLRREIAGRCGAADLIGRSRVMEKMLQLLPRIAESDSTVLIQGETGTGKELVARAVHDLSPRRDHAFVAVNCGALPDTLLESELFGYRAGAFTGAEKDKPGLFEEAYGGTLLLDEIGDVSAAFQIRLLRVLQERTFTPLGGTKPVKTDVRVLATTHRDLEERVEKGLFRQDLYYRIHVVCLNVPPLRERKEDIPALVRHFIEKLNARQGCSVTGISPEALHRLMRHEFPGNIRELENIIEHAVALCPEGVIQTNCLPGVAEQAHSTEPGIRAGRRAKEAQMILDALKRNEFNRRAAARELGIHKSTLYRKIKSLKLELPSARASGSEKER
ncbi:MAG TPA: PAS domain-containing protein [bacterium]|nr:PAS domain-containing protein [bacterium]